MGNILENLRSVYQLLEDEESKYVYIHRLNYLITGDRSYIDQIVTTYMPHLPVRKRIEDILSWMPAKHGIILYGAGEQGEKILPFVKDDKRFIGFCSKNVRKQENGYLGYPVISPGALLRKKDTSIIVSTIKYQEEIVAFLKGNHYPEDSIFTLEDFWGTSDEEEYFAYDFFQYTTDEIFIDAGAFDLSTSLQFKQHCPNVKKIYAFEPDPASFEICLKRKEETGLSEVTIYPMGTWNKKDTLNFNASGDFGAHLDQQGFPGASVSVVPIDDVVVPGERVTFIKMDVEGAELESLQGAKQTIIRCNPKLAICIYHKPEDMVTIPLYIKELIPDYHFYIRHHSNCEYDTVLYATV